MVPGDGNRHPEKTFIIYMIKLEYSVFAVPGQGWPDRRSPGLPLSGRGEKRDLIPGNSWRIVSP
jgi:hypothetical protein